VRQRGSAVVQSERERRRGQTIRQSIHSAIRQAGGKRFRFSLGQARGYHFGASRQAGGQRLGLHRAFRVDVP
jgi:hypothetical protein